MTARFFMLVSVLLTALLCALSLGGRLFYLVAFTLMAMLCYGLLSLVWLRLSLEINQGVSAQKQERGQTDKLFIKVRSSCPLPVRPLVFHIALPDGEGTASLSVPAFRQTETAFPFSLPHVGLAQAKLRQVTLQDLFGLFKLKKTLKEDSRVLVLPRPFELTRLKALSRDDGKALPNQSQEDVTQPEDTRQYRLGDQMKRVHWKLSAQKRELIVRRFEVPTPPDSLILMDCAAPVGAEGVADGAARLRDTLCETALSMAKVQLMAGHPVRLPLYGARATECHVTDERGLPHLQESLAMQIFREGEPFPRVLALEMRRMRRTGAAIIISTRLDAAVVEAVKQIRRSGPSARFYLVTFNPGDERYQPYISALQNHLVEVHYVSPA